MILDKDKFTPDTKFKTQFPWTDVISCFDERLPSENFKNHDECPKCKRNSEDLFWIEFSSPDRAWKNLCGRQGPLSICPKCNIQVEFKIEKMN